MKRVASILRALGLGEERLLMTAASAAEGGVFADTATTFTERIRKMGPSPLRGA